jgi:hypothetical protein
MRKPARLLIVLCALQCFLLAQTSVQSVEGVVVDRVTSAAIPGVNLELTGIAGDRVLSYSGKTDAQGRFVFRSVAVSAGYWLIANHEDAHMQTVYGQQRLP